MNFVVGFCGDGANDCGALKTAHVGISLSEAEASVAAPFTSSIQDISCVPKLLYEGRSGLRTTFNCFKYMMLYSVIQFTTVTILYFDYAYLSNYQFLYIDLLVIIPLGFTMSLVKARKKLTKKTPNDSLFKELPSFLGLSLIQIGFQLIVYIALTQQSWYLDAAELSEDEVVEYGYQQSYERTVTHHPLYKSYRHSSSSPTSSTCSRWWHSREGSHSRMHSTRTPGSRCSRCWCSW